MEHQTAASHAFGLDYINTSSILPLDAEDEQVRKFTVKNYANLVGLQNLDASLV